jgi:hypothetical protein
LTCEAVLACETHHDDNGAYLRVPASSIFDLGAEIRGVVNAARQPNNSTEPPNERL